MSQSNCSIFFLIANTTCSFALLWWKMPCRFTNSGFFFIMAIFNLSNWLQYFSELIYFEKGIHSRHLSNLTKWRDWKKLSSGEIQALRLEDLLSLDQVCFRCTFWYRIQVSFAVQISLKKDLFHIAEETNGTRDVIHKAGFHQ